MAVSSYNLPLFARSGKITLVNFSVNSLLSRAPRYADIRFGRFKIYEFKRPKVLSEVVHISTGADIIAKLMLLLLACVT